MENVIDSDKLASTISKLKDRIEQKFPGSSLLEQCSKTLMIAGKAKERVAWIEKPHPGLRLALLVIILLLIGAIFFIAKIIKYDESQLALTQFLQALQAGIQDAIYVSLAIFFIVQFEIIILRRRAVKSIHELRVLAHIIDLLHLTKDENIIFKAGEHGETARSKMMTSSELKYYLSYCAELLSYTSKIAVLYAQTVNDPVVAASVNEIENLTTNLSSKIWQKMQVIIDIESRG